MEGPDPSYSCLLMHFGWKLENVQMRLHVVRRQFGSTNLSIPHYGHLQIPKFN